MNIKTRLTEKDFIDANFIMLYSKLSTKIITGIGTLFLLALITISMYDGRHNPFSQFLMPAIVLIGLPVMTYFTAKKNYAANHRIGEQMEYIFDDTSLTIKGESFTSQLSWDKIYKVTQTNNWIFIWHTKQTANPLPKRDVWREKQTELKDFLTRHRVKNKLD